MNGATVTTCLVESWTTFEGAAAASLPASLDPSMERSFGRRLAREFQEKGHLRHTPTEALAWSDLAIAVFYRTLGEGASERTRPADADWMLTSDYAFVNIRACSPDSGRTGRITDALKMIPTMRVSSIHLAPFFDCCMENLYAVDSVEVVNPALVHPGLLEAGLSGTDQMRMLLDGIHRLGWTAGFDLEPHTSTFSRVALSHPDCFRWLHYNEARDGFAGDVTQEEMLSPASQQALVEELKALVSEVVVEHGLSAVEDMSLGHARVDECHQAAIRRLIAEGWWTLPSHTWNGVGLPAFDEYRAEGYPDYEYLDVEGEDQHKHSFGMLSPYRLYDGLPINESPDLEERRPVLYQPGVDLLLSVFPTIRDRFGFDFVRLDYVDHVFDSTVEKSWDVPASDRLTPAVLGSLLAKAREGAPWVGAMAERMGVDVEDYGALGFDLLLGTDVLTTMHPGYLEFTLDLQQELNGEARETKITAPSVESPEDGPAPRRCSTLAAIDTHDSGHPLFWTVPLSQAVGAEGMALRHFLARFTSWGTRRRPKYEVMGNQDLSWGLYQANNKSVALQWEGDQAFNRRYHDLEDVYAGVRDLLDRARLGPHHADTDKRWGVWFLDSQGDRRERLLCVAVLEPPVEKLVDMVEEPPAMEPVDFLLIDVAMGMSMQRPVVTQVLLDASGETPVALEGTMLRISELQPRECRLFRIRDES